MDTKVLAFLARERVCALTTLLPDGSPHAAAMHFSHKGQPLEVYFSTKNTGRKCQALSAGTRTKAAVVIGFSEEEWKTLQMEGEIEIVTETTEIGAIQDVHYAKNKESAKYKDDPATVFLKFTPTWWRYTDFKTTPPTILSSG